MKRLLILLCVFFMGCAMSDENKIDEWNEADKATQPGEVDREAPDEVENAADEAEQEARSGETDADAAEKKVRDEMTDGD